MSLLDYLDRTPLAYWSVAWLAYALLLAYVAWPAMRRGSTGSRPPPSGGGAEARRWLDSDWVFGALLGFALLAFRWPILFYDGELNPDESFFIVGARRLAEHATFWKQMDGYTSGPLNFYPLLAIKLFGLEISYGTIRLLCLTLQGGVVCFQYLAARRAFGRPVARLGVLPLVSFFAFSSYFDFVHYSSEQMPIFLFSIGVWLASGIFFRPHSLGFFRLFGVGFLAGMLPFAKIQAIPLSLAFFILVAGGVFVQTRRDGQAKVWPPLMKLALGYVSFPILIMIHNLITGAMGDFFQLFIYANFIYAGGAVQWETHSPWLLLWNFFAIGGNAEGFNSYFIGVLFFSAIAGGMILLNRKAVWLVGGIFMLNGTALFIAVYPGWVFSHYLFFLVATLGLLIATLLGEAWKLAGAEPPENARRMRIGLTIVLCLTGLLPQIIGRLASPNPMLGALTGTQRFSPGGIFFPNPALHRMPASSVIAQVVKPGEPMASWGWMIKIFVESGTSLTGRSMESLWEIPDTPMREYARKIYLDDLKATKPGVFVDLVGPTSFCFTDRSKQGHESFPALKDYIAQNYALIADVDSVRIFVSKDRLPAGLKAVAAAAATYRARGLAAAKEKNYAAALADLTTAFRLAPNSAEILADHGMVLFRGGRTADGLGEMNKALIGKPELHEVRLARARFRQQVGDLPGALADVRDVLRLAPADWPSRQEAAKLEGGLMPDTAVASNRLGVAAYQAKRYDEALANFDAALRSDPEFADARANRGTLLYQAGRRAEGLADLDRALQKNPRMLDARVFRAQIRQQAGNLTGALADVREAIRVAPADWPQREAADQLERDLMPAAALTSNRLGMTAYQAQRYDEALAHYNTALSLDPEYAAARANRGVLLYQAGHQAEGLADLDRALQLKPGMPNPMFLRARFRQREGDLNGALADVREALRLAAADWPNRQEAEKLEKTLSLAAHGP